MSYASIDDIKKIEKLSKWEDRDVPKTLYGMLSRAAQNYPNHDAVSYQIFSGPKDKAETFSWKELFDKSTQAANMFRSLGINETDVVAYVLPNANETLFSLLGGAISGIVASFILAISRAIGETMIVSLAAGGKPALTINPLDAIQTMTAYIVTVSQGETPQGSVEYNSIFAVGLLLFFLTLIMNLIGRFIVTKYAQNYE